MNIIEKRTNDFFQQVITETVFYSSFSAVLMIDYLVGKFFSIGAAIGLMAILIAVEVLIAIKLFRK